MRERMWNCTVISAAKTMFFLWKRSKTLPDEKTAGFLQSESVQTRKQGKKNELKPDLMFGIMIFKRRNKKDEKREENRRTGIKIRCDFMKVLDKDA